MIRALDPTRPDEVDLVARRMRETLIEVLGAQRGTALYTLDWLRDRVRWHLDPAACTGQVFLSETAGEVTGHTIVRLERDEGGEPFGLFSTIYVKPSARGRGVATRLLSRGEAWLIERGQRTLVTQTAEDNTRLIQLFEKQGFQVLEAKPAAEMVRLSKTLGASSADSGNLRA